MLRNMQESNPNASTIVLWARQATGESQRKFADRLGSSQSLICKYERGEVSPPAALLIQCMNLIGVSAPGISAEDLATLVKTRLKGEAMASARQAVANLIQCMPGQSQRRKGRSINNMA